MSRFTSKSARSHPTDEQGRALVALPDDGSLLACAVCGRAVSAATLDRWGHVSVAVRPGGVPAGLAARHTRSVEVPLGLCDQCEQLLADAEQATEAHPKFLSAAGPGRAYDLVGGILVGSAVLDHPAELAVSPVTDLPDAVEALGSLGWRACFHQQLHGDRVGLQGHAAAEPWGHVPEALRLQLRATLAKHRTERLAESAPPLSVPCPAAPTPSYGGTAVSSGCACCGVAAVDVPAVALVRHGRAEVTRDTWAPLDIAGDLSAHLCPACQAAYEKRGGFGAACAEIALTSFLDPRLGTQWEIRAELQGAELDPPVRTYADLVRAAARTGRPNPPPCATPWAHLGTVADLDRLRQEIARGLGLDLGTSPAVTR
ncbi:hypothetical protein [Raineyella sp. LH-20]|uniref:hypothetical protein n=1 Tax=Raineyella sp. LH-20 TaxID=3081204 RepID=UPI0029532CB1|nr:hypothetical protein [Raineyella sp. LH-20]WOP17402.1 hypothetical protein R0146_08915 [Raineyella sp. LH-20]